MPSTNANARNLLIDNIMDANRRLHKRQSSLLEIEKSGSLHDNTTCCSPGAIDIDATQTIRADTH